MFRTVKYSMQGSKVLIFQPQELNNLPVVLEKGDLKDGAKTLQKNSLGYSDYMDFEESIKTFDISFLFAWTSRRLRCKASP